MEVDVVVQATVEVVVDVQFDIDVAAEVDVEKEWTSSSTRRRGRGSYAETEVATRWSKRRRGRGGRGGRTGGCGRGGQRRRGTSTLTDVEVVDVHEKMEATYTRKWRSTSW
jgi:hypothetical protein